MIRYVKRAELGDLTPIRGVMQWLDEWEKTDKARRPDSEPVVHTLTTVRSRLEEAIDNAVNPLPEPTIKEIAEAEGVTKWAVYKRRQRARRKQTA